MAQPHVITLGCRLNIAESEAMRALAGQAGRDDLVIVNSCAVTAEAVRQARQAIRRARRDRPGAHIIVTGCAAQVDPAMFAAMPEVDGVLGNREKLEVAAFAPDAQRVQVSDIMAVRDTAPHLVTGFADHARAFLEVQNGCDHRCTFCIIPYGRGANRSVPAGAVVEQVKALVGQGYGEVVLTGVDVTSYGADLPARAGLGHLVERILRHVPDLPRLRLSSLDCAGVDDRLFALLTGERRVMPHVHLSLQAGDDLILKRMKRRHNRGQAIALVERLCAARPEIAIGADIIAGFPTESEAMFVNSLRLVEECAIVHGHVFPYSPRAGTPAARMPQGTRATVRDRAARLRDACARQRARWLDSLAGSRQSVLVEGDGTRGHAANFAPVRFSAAQRRGEIVDVAICGVEGGEMIAQEAA